jgi:ATP adenylyltransferase
LKQAASGKKACIFCFENLTEAERRKRLVLFDNRDAIVMLNRYPYNNGHVMVSPRRHVASIELLRREERTVIDDLMAASVKVLRTVMKPNGFNLGANLGRSAGAGFVDHMHWHVVPRWDGDNNFMPVLASTRVLSQSLDDSFKQLRPVFKALSADLS